jgi:hypothetical protein
MTQGKAAFCRMPPLPAKNLAPHHLPAGTQ